MAIDTLAADLTRATDEELATWSRSQERDLETARLKSGSDIYAAERARRGWGW